MAVTVTGQLELDKNLKEIAARFPRIRNKALKKAGEAVRLRLAVNTSYNANRKSDRKWKAQRQYEKKTGNVTVFPHMRDDVVASNVNSVGELKIGYSEKTYWRAHFPNGGTINQTGTHFMEKTEEEMEAEVMEIMATELKVGLGL